ncbi:hypothetical protein N7499_001510 [Penicillium canescens]|uniref:Uncharacterized protein n=1 Tax=Penicillium canescens TaxID=5083 RepID=A0AAD6I755_PENCN|nr:uncharacterized protein N7446_009049 [Penicillium canescens]KAJ5981482.1 hypothetical protein N7522_013903 [Penicillium canescens]KAJ6034301.1 hypothetical protein N7460_008476 [Penicillium canescens]KAJ6045964.1 hypothetical protein N7444_007218 [Penicillium canescens]KAJ6053037.1 hypothetical protein N7446_009049 [Penicillium canescens]KAJ6097136.1 hypothetical protein N7499_001510 [Penicillium canescens]
MCHDQTTVRWRGGTGGNLEMEAELTKCRRNKTVWPDFNGFSASLMVEMCLSRARGREDVGRGPLHVPKSGIFGQYKKSPTKDAFRTSRV